jgi:uncharacterized protein YqeY
MLTQTLKAAATEAMKSKDTVTTTVVRVALGEIQTAEARANRALTDEEAQAILRKLVKSNEETLASLGTEASEARSTLERENAILIGFLPAALSPEQLAGHLAPVAEAIKAAKNDGQATGIAMKHLKASGVSATGNEVGAAVRRMRE